MTHYKMSDVAVEVNDRENNPASSKYDRFVGLEHYVSGEVIIRNYGSTENLESTMKIFQSGDVLVARRNVYLKRASMVDFDGLTSGDSIVLRAKNPVIGRILPFVLNTDAFWDFADQYSDGTMSKRLSPKTLMTYEFDLPDEEELEKFADLLWAANDTRESYQALLRQTDELVKSQFIELFGRPEDNNMGWDMGTIRDIVSDVRYGSSRQASSDGKYPYIRMNNITYGGELDLTDLKRINIPDNELAKCTVRKGDVLFNRTNSKELVGKTCLYDRDETMVLAGFVIRVRMNEKATPEFLVQYMNLPYMKELLLSMCKAACGQANINAQELQNIPIYIPPIDIQKRFIVLKQQTDKSKFEIKKAIENTSALIKSLMQQDLTN